MVSILFIEKVNFIIISNTQVMVLFIHETFLKKYLNFVSFVLLYSPIYSFESLHECFIQISLTFYLSFIQFNFP